MELCRRVADAVGKVIDEEIGATGLPVLPRSVLA